MHVCICTVGPPLSESPLSEQIHLSEHNLALKWHIGVWIIEVLLYIACYVSNVCMCMYI